MEKLEISISMVGVPQIAHGIFKNESFHGGSGKYSAEMAAKRPVVRQKQESPHKKRPRALFSCNAFLWKNVMRIAMYK